MLSGLILGLLPPLAFLTAAWWGSVPFFVDNEAYIALCALIGLTLGIILDFVLLRRYLFRLFELPIWVLIVAEVIYSFLFYVYMMGLPVLVCLTGMVSIYVVSKRAFLLRMNEKQRKKELNIVRFISFGLLLGLCGVSAWLALDDATMLLELQGMLHLSFAPTTGFLWFVIIGGTLFLLALEVLASIFFPKWMAHKCTEDNKI